LSHDGPQKEKLMMTPAVLQRHLHGRWFRLSENQFDVIHYSGMAAYKIAVLSLNVAPCIALRLAASQGA
jgi:hypothetical protein